MIPVMPSYVSNRELIRNTWYKGFNDSEDVMLRFAMGTKDISSNLSTQLNRENDIHKDMIFFENFKENRSALTNKTILLITWAYEYVNFTYFLKCDDDTFVFVKRTVAELMRRPTTTRLYSGKIQKGRPKKKNSPWQDVGWNLGDTYLPYALGGAYIISSVSNILDENICWKDRLCYQNILITENHEKVALSNVYTHAHIRMYTPQSHTLLVSVRICMGFKSPLKSRMVALVLQQYVA